MDFAFLFVRKTHRLFFAGVIACCFLSHPVSAQETDSTIASRDASTVIALVNHNKVTLGGLKHELDATIGGKVISSARRKKLEKVTLTKLLNQLVILEFLKSRKATATPSEIRVRLEAIESELAKVGQTLEGKLKSTGLTRSEFDSQLAWQLSWNKYLATKLDDTFLKKHFDKNARKFDGTELRVAHLLLKRSDGGKDSSQLINEANSIRDKLVSNDAGLNWTKAVEQYSNAPTRETRGEIGWIKRSGPMPVSFNEAAFKLKANEISKPVTTSFGVHLIKCLEVKQGKIGWLDAKDTVRKDATRSLFDAIVKQHRADVKIEIR